MIKIDLDTTKADSACALRRNKHPAAFSFIIMLILFMFLPDTKGETGTFGILELTDGSVLIGFIEPGEENQIRIHDFRLGDQTLAKKMIMKTQTLKIGTSYLIRTTDGRTLVGTIVSVGKEHIAVESPLLGSISIPPEAITDFRLNLKIHFPNPNATRYFFAPSAFMLPKGEGYYQNTYILMNSINYGLTEKFTLAGGVILPFWFYVTPKFGLQLSEHLAAACGLFYATSIILDRGMDMGLGIGYGMLTAGGREYNITVACGYGYSRIGRNWDLTKYPIVMLGGMKRISPRFSLVTENWAVSSKFMQERVTGYVTDEWGGTYPVTDMVWNGTYKYNGIVSLGLRWMTEKISFDLALVLPVNIMDQFLILPYLDFFYKF
jgi:hypothetical protein